jgi:hypothetical protein
MTSKNDPGEQLNENDALVIFKPELWGFLHRRRHMLRYAIEHSPSFSAGNISSVKFEASGQA